MQERKDIKIILSGLDNAGKSSMLVGLRQMYGFEDVVEKITYIDPITGNLLNEVDMVAVYPAKHFLTTQSTIDKALISIEDELNKHLKLLKSKEKVLEAQRLSSRTKYDMEMLKEIGSPDNVEAYVNHVLESGGKIFGLGHAVYKTDDPRAHILAPMSKTMGEKTGDTKWYDMSRILEEKGKSAFKERKGTDIYVNVDFYSASLYYSMGIPLDLFTPIFAVSRVAGWTTHVIEEQFAGAAPKPVLYRPESEYVGDYCGPDECAFVAIDER